MATSIGAIEQFDIKNGNLDTYIKRMNSYFLINKVENDVKVAAFLTLCGPKLYQEICNLLSGTIAPEELSYKKLTKLLLDHYNPKQYIVMERYKFNQRNQRKSETITEFVMAIKTLAQTCDFGTFLDDALRDRFVCGVQSNVIRNALLKEEELTMDKAKNLAFAIELSEPNEKSTKTKKDNNKNGNSKKNKSASENEDDEKIENNDCKKQKKKQKDKNKKENSKKDESSSDNEKDDDNKVKKDKNKKGNSRKKVSSSENEDENKLSTKNYRNKDNRDDDNTNFNRKTINCFRCGGVGHVSKYCNALPLLQKHFHHRQSLTNLYVSNNLSNHQPTTPTRMSTSVVTYINNNNNNNNTSKTNSKTNSNSKEVPTTSLNKLNIEEYTWVPTTGFADLPTGAVYAGTDGDVALTYIGRAIHNGVQFPAKVIPSKQISYISYHGQEIPKYQFDVLVGEFFAWMTSDNGRVPLNAVVCSNLSDGEPLYIGRARFGSSLIPGKIQPSHGCLYISHNGAEHKIQQYEVLIGTQRR